MDGVSWDNVEKEFNDAADGVRGKIYHDVVHLHTYCSNCKVQQSKGVGWLGRKLPPWELKDAENVTRMIASTVSNKNLPPNIRKAFASYRDSHISYSCESGLKTITNFFNTLENCLD